MLIGNDVTFPAFSKTGSILIGHHYQHHHHDHQVQLYCDFQNIHSEWFIIVLTFITIITIRFRRQVDWSVSSFTPKATPFSFVLSLQSLMPPGKYISFYKKHWIDENSIKTKIKTLFSLIPSGKSQTKSKNNHCPLYSTFLPTTFCADPFIGDMFQVKVFFSGHYCSCLSWMMALGLFYHTFWVLNGGGLTWPAQAGNEVKIRKSAKKETGIEIQIYSAKINFGRLKCSWINSVLTPFNSSPSFSPFSSSTEIFLYRESAHRESMYVIKAFTELTIVNRMTARRSHIVCKIK